jgi:CrcB protein
MIGLERMAHAEQRSETGAGDQFEYGHNEDRQTVYVNLLVIAIGGAIGTAARHGVNLLCARLLERQAPYATAIVNLVGAGIIGLLAGLIASDRLHLEPTPRAFVVVGLLGGFTTFSSYMLDSFTLARGGEFGMALANIAGQTALGFAAVWAGYAAALAMR